MTNVCPATGDEGVVTFNDFDDEWKVHCPTCGTTWMGGGPILVPHESPEDRLAGNSMTSPRPQ